jgi:hypothetical protein
LLGDRFIELVLENVHHWVSASTLVARAIAKKERERERREQERVSERGTSASGGDGDVGASGIAGGTAGASGSGLYASAGIFSDDKKQTLRGERSTAF